MAEAHAARGQRVDVRRLQARVAVAREVVGALIFWALNKFLSDYGTWYLLGLGLLAIVVTIFFKQGLWGYAQQRWGWSLFPTQRRLALHVSKSPMPAARIPELELHPHAKHQ